MEFRIFTENDKVAITYALMAFLREMDGMTRKRDTVLPVVEHALDGGITLDELFNRQNWIRAAAEINGLSPEDYVTLMVNRNIVCRPIIQEEGWCDDLDNMSLIAKCFHEFYIKICPKGGTWSTDNARINLEKAIKLHSLQALMSEKSIIAAYGDEDEPELTCFNYILGITKNRILVDDTKSESQMMKEQADRELAVVEDDAAEDCSERQEADPADCEGLRTEPQPESDDETIYPADDIYDNDDLWQSGEDTFISLTNPREMKKNAILSIIYNYMMEELNELIALVPNVTTLADFVEKLTDGCIDTANESIRAREIHQIMSGELIPSFISCVNMQGFEMNEELAASHDPLTEKWDFRDENTRKVHKLKRLIYTHGADDQDLLNCISDIEKLYSAN